MATHQFEISFIELPFARTSISVEPMVPARLVAVIPAGHRLAHKKQVSVKDLAGERMILLSQHSFLRYQIDDAFASLDEAPHVVLETPHSNITCAYAAAGIGITLVPHWAAQSFAGQNVAVRPLKGELTSRSAIIFPNPGPRLMLAEAFAADIKRHIEQSDLR